jgi:tetratricopeptide (TPR) repeat protein
MRFRLTITLLIAALSSCVSAQDLFQKGVTEESQGNREKAIEYYSAAIQTDADFVKAYNNRALIYMQNNRLADAATDLDEALRRQSQYAPALVNRGILYEKQGDLERAYGSYDAASQADGALLAARFNAAKAALSLGRTKDAVLHIDEAKKIAPADPAVNRLAARIYLAAGRSGEARDIYKAIYDGDGKDEEALVGLIQASRRIGRRDDALKYAEIYARERPACSRCIILLSSLYLENGRNETALTTLETGVQRFPSDSTMRYRLGLLYAGKGERAKAVAQLEEYVKLRGEETDEEAEAAKTLLATMKKK